MIYSTQIFELYYKKGLRRTMPFKKMEKPNVPPRLWVLVGYPGSGKSTFATQMRTPLLPVDADHRFEEVVHLAKGDVYQLSDNRADSVDPESIYRLLNTNMPNSGVKTIVVDSLTTIITPKVVQAVMDNDAGRNRNRMAGFKDKALSMRLLQDAVTMWGTDVLWIYHLQDSRDEQAREVVKATLSATERARLYRSINLELHIIQEPVAGTKQVRRGIKVVWARRGRAGMTLWDESGKWEGMAEKIEQAVYGGLTVEDQDRIEQETPAVFATEEAAIEWGQGQGVFNELTHAKNAFNKLKKANPNLTLARLSVMWVDEVENRQKQRADEEKRPEEQPQQPAEEQPLTGLEGFTYRCMVEVGFFESHEEVVQALANLGMVYDPGQEEALLELLRIHIQALPTFTESNSLLYQINQDFGLSEAEARAKLKELGFTGFPKDGNGEARTKSRRMYWKVKVSTPAKVRPAVEEIPF